MVKLIDSVIAAATPHINEVARLTGQSASDTKTAVKATIAAILSAMSTTLQTPSGVSAVSRLINDPVNDGSLKNQLSALYQGTMSAAPIYRLGRQLLDAVFQDKHQRVTDTIAALSGVKPTSASTIASILAPHILTLIGERHRTSGDTQPSEWSHALIAESPEIAAALPPALVPVLGVAHLTSSSHAALAAVPAEAPHTPHAHAASSIPPPPHRPATATPSAIAKGGVERTSGTLAPMGGARPHAVGRGSPNSGGAPWMIFPLGIGAGLGLFALGSVFGEWPRQGGYAPAEVAVAPPAVTTARVEPAAKPVSPLAPASATTATPAPTATAKSQTPPATPATAPTSTTLTKNVPGPQTAQTAPAKAPSAAPSTAVAPPTPATPSKPATASKVAAPAPAVGPPGVTTFFGATPPMGEAPAVANPDYKPAVAASEPVPVPAPAATMAAATPPVSAASDAPIAPPDVVKIAPPPPEGITTFFGNTPTAAEAPAVLNPEYKPSANINTAEAPTTSPNGADGVTTTPAPAPPNPAAPTQEVAAVTPPSPTAPKSSPPLPPQLQECETNVTQAAKSGSILFATSLAQLEPESHATLDKIASAASACKDARITIEGHTDDSGSAELNDTLSAERAKAVGDYLTAHGVGANQIVTKGYGASKPLVPNTSAENKAQNRRIEFVVEPL